MNIVVVDDEPLILKGLVAILRQQSHAFESIRTAPNGVKALQLIEEAVPQLLFTDIRMPKMDGLELCRRVHERYPQVQMIIISGYGDFEYAQSCIDYGVKQYLLKPFTPTKIHQLIHKLAAHSEASFSISEYEDWIGKIAEAVWSLRTDLVEELLEQWRAYCEKTSSSEANLLRMLSEGLPMLSKRLSLKGCPSKLDLVSPMADKEQYYLLLHSRVLNLVDELALQRGGQDLMHKAKMYLDENITKDLSLEDVAAYVGITAPYLSLLFKKVHKETFVHYRIMRRIQMAKQLLEIPHYRTNDIAYEVGYENYPHFSRTFKKVTGLSPLEYRQTMGIK